MKHTHILFLDIETVPEAPTLNGLSLEAIALFEKRFKHRVKDDESRRSSLLDLYEDTASLYAENANICSIAVGFLVKTGEMRIKSMASKDERSLLQELINILVPVDVATPPRFTKLCAHNGKSFDFPFLCRRMIVNKLHIPHILNPWGVKTWELPWIDTMELWGFGEWKYKVSLAQLCYTMGLPSPKAEMDGSEVKDYYYGANPGPEDLPFGKFDKEEARMASIARYCAGDIVALVNVFLRLNNESIIPEDKIIFA